MITSRLYPVIREETGSGASYKACIYACTMYKYTVYMDSMCFLCVYCILCVACVHFMCDTHMCKVNLDGSRR